METPPETDSQQRNVISRLALVGCGYAYGFAALIPNSTAIYAILLKFQMSYIWGMSMLLACTVAVWTISGGALRPGDTGLGLVLGAGSAKADEMFAPTGGMGWYVFLTVVALWGGLLAHARRYEDGHRPKSVIWTLVVDIGGAGLVTVGVYAIAVWAGASQFMSVALAGILGHNGVRLLSVFEDEITQTVRVMFSSVRGRIK